MDTLELQLHALVVFALAGVLTGVLFDFLRVLRQVYRPEDWAATLLDLLYWLLVAVVMVSALLLGNWGSLRAFIPVAMAIGLFTYLALAGAAVRACLHLVLQGLTWLVGLLANLVTMLFVVPIVRMAWWGWGFSTGLVRFLTAWGDVLFRPFRRAGRQLGTYCRGASGRASGRMAQWLGKKK